MPVSLCTHDSHRMRSRRALRMLLSADLVSASPRYKTQRDDAHDHVCCGAIAHRSGRCSAAAHEVDYADLSRPRRCVPWPSVGCFPALWFQLDRISGQENSGHWLDTIRTDTVIRRMPWSGMRATRAMCAFESSYYVVTSFKNRYLPGPLTPGPHAGRWRAAHSHTAPRSPHRSQLTPLTGRTAAGARGGGVGSEARSRAARPRAERNIR